MWGMESEDGSDNKSILAQLCDNESETVSSLKGLSENIEPTFLWKDKLKKLAKNIKIAREEEEKLNSDDKDSDSETSNDVGPDEQGLLLEGEFLRSAIYNLCVESVQDLLPHCNKLVLNQVYQEQTALDCAVEKYGILKNKLRKEKIREIIQLFLTCEKVEDAGKSRCVNNLFCAAAEKNDLETIEWIIDKAPKELCGAFLIEAVRLGNLTIVKNVYGKGFNNINAFDQYGKTALHYAAEKDNKDIANFLREKGANPHTWDNNGIAPRDLMPKLIKDKSWGSWLVNRGPEVLNNLLTGITTATLGYYAYKPTTTKLGVLSLLMAGLIGSHAAEKKVQKNYTDYGYCNRNFGKKCLLGLAGAVIPWVHQKLQKNSAPSCNMNSQ